MRRAQPQKAKDACRRFSSPAVPRPAPLGRGSWAARTERRIFRATLPDATRGAAFGSPRNPVTFSDPTDNVNAKWTADRRGRGLGTASWRRHQGYHGKWLQARTHLCSVCDPRDPFPREIEKLPLTKIETEGGKQCLSPPRQHGLCAATEEAPARVHEREL